MKVEQILAAEGYKVSVVVYGWGALQTLIAKHPIAFNVFFPSAGAASEGQVSIQASPESLAAQIAEQLLPRMAQSGLTIQSKDLSNDGKDSEDRKRTRLNSSH